MLKNNFFANQNPPALNQETALKVRNVFIPLLNVAIATGDTAAEIAENAIDYMEKVPGAQSSTHLADYILRMSERFAPLIQRKGKFWEFLGSNPEDITGLEYEDFAAVCETAMRVAAIMGGRELLDKIKGDLEAVLFKAVTVEGGRQPSIAEAVGKTASIIGRPISRDNANKVASEIVSEPDVNDEDETSCITLLPRLIAESVDTYCAGTNVVFEVGEEEGGMVPCFLKGTYKDCLEAIQGGISAYFASQQE